jgi:hypothetical protein
MSIHEDRFLDSVLEKGIAMPCAQIAMVQYPAQLHLQHHDLRQRWEGKQKKLWLDNFITMRFVGSSLLLPTWNSH